MITAATLGVVITASTSGLESGLRRANQLVTGTGNFFANAASTALGFVGATVGLNAVANVAGAVNDAMFGLNNTLDEQAIAFTTLLGSGPKAAAFLGDLQRFANVTPFDTASIGLTAQRMLAVGFAAKDVIPLLTNIGGAVASLGGGTGELNRIVLAFTQIQSKGKLQGDELLQLSEAGIPGLQLLATHLGKTTVQTQKLIEAGKVKPDTFFAAFTDWARAHNLPAILMQSQTTWRGALSTIADVLRTGAASAFRPLFDLAKEGAVNLAKLLQTPAFDAFVARVRSGVAALVQPIGTIAVMTGNIAQTHGLNLVQAALVALEIVIGQTFGPNSAAAFHGFFDGLKTAGQWIIENGPRFFSWLVTTAPGAIETGIGKIAELKTWLDTNLPPAVEKVKAAFADIGAAVKDQFIQARGEVVGFIEFLAAIPLLGEPFKGIAAQVRAQFEDFLRAQGITPPTQATPAAATVAGGVTPVQAGSSLPRGLPTFSQTNPGLQPAGAVTVNFNNPQINASDERDIEQLGILIAQEYQKAQARAENRADPQLAGAQ